MDIESRYQSTASVQKGVKLIFSVLRQINSKHVINDLSYSEFISGFLAEMLLELVTGNDIKS